MPGDMSLCSLVADYLTWTCPTSWPEMLISVVAFKQGLHSASIPGILALDMCPSDTNKILTGMLRLWHWVISGLTMLAHSIPWSPRQHVLKGCWALSFPFPGASWVLSTGLWVSSFVFQVEPTKMLLSLIRLPSKFWQLSKAIPRRSPVSCFIHPR